MADWIITFITNYSYGGVFFLMVAENVFPPIPSEVVLPFIGRAVADGEMNFLLALLAATVGSLIGTSIWFLVGMFVPAIKLEKFLQNYGGYIAISARDFHKATEFFTKYQIPAVFFGRMIPGVRSVISIPAGSVQMKLKTFIVYSAIGSVIWNTALISVGYFLLNDFSVVAEYMNPITNGIFGLFIAIYFFQVVRFLIDKTRTT